MAFSMLHYIYYMRIALFIYLNLQLHFLQELNFVIWLQDELWVGYRSGLSYVSQKTPCNQAKEFLYFRTTISRGKGVTEHYYG